MCIRDSRSFVDGSARDASVPAAREHRLVVGGRRCLAGHRSSVGIRPTQASRARSMGWSGRHVPVASAHHELRSRFEATRELAHGRRAFFARVRSQLWTRRAALRSAACRGSRLRRRLALRSRSPVLARSWAIALCHASAPGGIPELVREGPRERGSAPQYCRLSVIRA